MPQNEATLAAPAATSPVFSKYTVDEVPAWANAALVLADGSAFYGTGFGAAGISCGELCFNTTMAGYQEILTDPSYAEQIVTFTFPHIGNTGANGDDIEAAIPRARGLIARELPTLPSNWRATGHLNDWLRRHNLIGLAGVDTRAITHRIRALGQTTGAPTAALIHRPQGKLDVLAALEAAKAWGDLNGRDLAEVASCTVPYQWQEGEIDLSGKPIVADKPDFHIVVVDYGVKRNILRLAATPNTFGAARLTVVPARTSAEDIIKLRPDGVLLSNGPGDPAATGLYAVPVIQQLLEVGLPIFGICLGHQLLSLALGARTYKLPTGHRGGNHPVKNLATGKVEITSQNHGFAVREDTLPKGASVSHRSLFDGTVEGIRLERRPVFSVQYHPEASPGPADSRYLFEEFFANMTRARQLLAA